MTPPAGQISAECLLLSASRRTIDTCVSELSSRVPPALRRAVAARVRPPPRSFHDSLLTAVEIQTVFWTPRNDECFTDFVCLGYVNGVQIFGLDAAATVEHTNVPHPQRECTVPSSALPLTARVAAFRTSVPVTSLQLLPDTEDQAKWRVALAQEALDGSHVIAVVSCWDGPGRAPVHVLRLGEPVVRMAASLTWSGTKNAWVTSLVAATASEIRVIDGGTLELRYTVRDCQVIRQPAFWNWLTAASGTGSRPSSCSQPARLEAHGNADTASTTTESHAKSWWGSPGSCPAFAVGSRWLIYQKARTPAASSPPHSPIVTKMSASRLRLRRLKRRLRNIASIEKPMLPLLAVQEPRHKRPLNKMPICSSSSEVVHEGYKHKLRIRHDRRLRSGSLARHKNQRQNSFPNSPKLLSENEGNSNCEEFIVDGDNVDSSDDKTSESEGMSTVTRAVTASGPIMMLDIVEGTVIGVVDFAATLSSCTDSNLLSHSACARPSHTTPPFPETVLESQMLNGILRRFGLLQNRPSHNQQQQDLRTPPPSGDVLEMADGAWTVSHVDRALNSEDEEPQQLSSWDLKSALSGRAPAVSLLSLDRTGTTLFCGEWTGRNCWAIRFAGVMTDLQDSLSKSRESSGNTQVGGETEEGAAAVPATEFFPPYTRSCPPFLVGIPVANMRRGGTVGMLTDIASNSSVCSDVVVGIGTARGSIHLFKLPAGFHMSCLSAAGGVPTCGTDETDEVVCPNCNRTLVAVQAPLLMSTSLLFPNRQSAFCSKCNKLQNVSLKFPTMLPLPAAVSATINDVPSPMSWIGKSADRCETPQDWILSRNDTSGDTIDRKRQNLPLSTSKHEGMPSIHRIINSFCKLSLGIKEGGGGAHNSTSQPDETHESTAATYRIVMPASPFIPWVYREKTEALTARLARRFREWSGGTSTNPKLSPSFFPNNDPLTSVVSQPMLVASSEGIIDFCVLEFSPDGDCHEDDANPTAEQQSCKQSMSGPAWMLGKIARVKAASIVHSTCTRDVGTGHAGPVAASWEIFSSSGDAAADSVDNQLSGVEQISMPNWSLECEPYTCMPGMAIVLLHRSNVKTRLLKAISCDCCGRSLTSAKGFSITANDEDAACVQTALWNRWARGGGDFPTRRETAERFPAAILTTLDQTPQQQQPRKLREPVAVLSDWAEDLAEDYVSANTAAPPPPPLVNLGPFVEFDADSEDAELPVRISLMTTTAVGEYVTFNEGG